MFDDICKRIISPPKFRYSLYDLGAAVSKLGKRSDFQVYNYKNYKINCSIYEPHSIQFERVCVIYLHSMNGSRLEGSIYTERILKQGVSFCIFDFAGCGNSEGEKISFGANEKYDIESVITKLKEAFYLNRFILWGRSMGSASAIKYSQLIHDNLRSAFLSRNQEILALILDSSFKSFSRLLIQIGHSQSEIPKLFIRAGFLIIKNSLEAHGEFKISDLDLIFESQSQNSEKKYPLEKLASFNLPILFLASKEDKTVSCQHSLEMYNTYNCNSKQIKFFKGLHNQSRQQDYMLEVVSFIQKILKSQAPIKPHPESFQADANLHCRRLPQSIITNKSITENNGHFPGNSFFNLIKKNFLTNEELLQNYSNFEFQSIESNCVCSMFGQNQSPKQSNFSKQKSPDQEVLPRISHISLTENEQNYREIDAAINAKQKKSLTQFSFYSYYRDLKRTGPNFQQTKKNSNYFSQAFTSSISSQFKKSAFNKKNSCRELKKQQGRDELFFQEMSKIACNQFKGPLKAQSQIFNPCFLNENYPQD